MLKKYKNGFIDLIRKHLLDPADFNVSENKSYPVDACMSGEPRVVTIIRFKKTPLIFEVFENPTSLHAFGPNYTRFDVGFPYLLHYRSGGEIKSKHRIGQVYDHFENWLSGQVIPYMEEMKQPDSWQQIEQQKQLVSADSLTEYDTSPFTEPEKQQARASIGQFRVLILESFGPIQEQLEVIDQRLDYLSAAVDRLNRFDWKGLALSIVVGIGINLCVDTEGGRRLFELFKRAFSGVLHLLQ